MLDTGAGVGYNSLCQAKRLGTISGLRWGRMEQLLYLSALFDFYGALLTEKQQECLKMHLFEDFSLSEIGEELGISRQAVYDNIHRSEKAMESYEEKLGLVARYQKERAVLADICRSVKALRTDANSAAVGDILARLVPLLGSSEYGREV